MLRAFLDDTSNRGSDAGSDVDIDQEYDPIAATDDQLFSDDTPASYEGSNYTDESDAANKPTERNSLERQSRIEKAKEGIQSKDRSKDKASDKDKDSKEAAPRLSFFNRNKKSDKKKDFLAPGSDSAKSDKDKKKDSSKGGAGDEKNGSAKTGISKLKSLFGKGGDEAHGGGLKDLAAKDPRKLAMHALDYVGIGRRVGDVMFMVWLIVTAILSIALIAPGIIGLLMLNLLLIWPKAVYKITVWILVFIPAVGEVVKTVDSVGLGKVDIKLNGVEKYFIIVVDLIWFIGMLALFGFIMTIICYPINNVGVVGTTVADVWYGTSLFSELQGFCKGL